MYLRGSGGSRAFDTGSEREHCSILAGAEHIHDGLTHEQTDGDANCDCNHGTSNINPRPVRGDTSCLRKARLKAVKIESGNIQNKSEGRNTHWDQEQDTRDHRGECGATHLPRIDIPEQTHCKRADSRNNI